jgi:DNA invertase Pin-like site-specific DNA recombinase
MAKVVEIIPAKPIQELRGLEVAARLRVCAYCRVSTDNIEQLGSLEAQTEHYTRYIQQNSAWEFCGIYADEGISGTNTKKRVAFNNMIEACLTGEIDMIITKSVSRFARNTLDCLKYIRLLKERGIAVFFEKENVNTLDSKGEFMITLLGSLAQEESNNLSKITRMGIVYRFQSGKLMINHSRFLGYTKNENGELIIDQEQAEIVRRIFKEFLLGYSTHKIAKKLTEEKVMNGAGNTKWWESSVRKILQNEKYMGDALLQKTYTIDYLNKLRAKNKGQMPKYYVENSHPPIISKEDFTAAQAEFLRRSNMRGYSKTGKSAFTSEYAFSGKLFCENCGSKFRRIFYGKAENKKAYWICINHQLSGKESCNTNTTRESTIEEAFVRAINNQVISDKGTFMKTLSENIRIGLTRSAQKSMIEEIDRGLMELSKEMMYLVRQSSKTADGVNTNDKEYADLANKIESLRNQRQEMKKADAERALQEERIKDLISFLDEQNTPLDDFDEALFRRVIDKMIILPRDHIIFVFKCGMEVRETLPKR